MASGTTLQWAHLQAVTYTGAMGDFSFRGAARTLFAALIGVLLNLVVATAAAADEGSEDVENFRYTSWQVHYDLKVDAEGRTQAEVAEILDAQFPEFDQNRGIIRSLPLRYQGAPAAPEDISVTDGAGDRVPFEIEDSEGFRSILVGDDSFVHGEQTYVISYTVDDVIHAPDDADEFYWDLIPVDRQQEIGEVSAHVSLDDTLTGALNGDVACYRGSPENTQSCDIKVSSDESTLEVTSVDLAAGQGITLAVGFEPGTVAQPPEREGSFVLDVLPVIFVGISVILAAAGAFGVATMVRRHRNDTSHTNIAYGIPAAMNPLIAQWITGRRNEPIVATLLDLAVRGVVRIEEAPDAAKQKKPKPMLRLVDPESATDPLEVQLLEALFPDLTPGTVFTFPKYSKKFTKAAQQAMRDSGQAVIDRGYQQKTRHRGAAIAGWIALVFLIPVVVLLILGASRDNTPTTVAGVVVGLLSLALLFVCVMPHRVLTPYGAATRRQLEQLRTTMTASEADRLEAMQSFAQAPRTQPSHHAFDDSHIIRIYDRFLPYAVLFGRQKDWSKALANAYQHYNMTPPAWYPALWAHGATGMHNSLDSMLSSVSSAASTSSSGAGSTGGGVAGGGGGGGAAGGR